MLVLVSNRLPVTFHREGSALHARSSLGGVATGLASVAEEKETVWVGWPGPLPPRDRKAARRILAADYHCRAVDLPSAVAHRYYAGFSNGTLWPLFHSFASHARYAHEDWEAYRTANELFAEAVLEVAGPKDTIWIHDYQLLLLPKLLRARRPSARIGFFLHIPFPPYDTLRVLPWHRELLEGMLGADLVGFHTFDYAQAFLSNVRRVLGLDNEIGQLFVGARAVQVDVFPMGIDAERFERAATLPEVRAEVARVRRSVHDSRVVLSLSRLDYTKGIPEELAAIETFFERHPDWRDRVTFVLIVVPSRERVETYAALKREIDETVGRINSRFGHLDWMPVRYVYHALPFEELLGLYAAADVLLAVPLRDGMNLVAKEYLAAHPDDAGVLVLSEMAGASRELLEALRVNPNHREEVAEAIHRALTLEPDDRARRSRALRARVREYDLKRWSHHFLARLEDAVAASDRLAVRLVTPKVAKALADAYAAAERRLLILDYDGTLVPFASDPASVGPSPRVRNLLDRLAASPRNTVLVMSGRRKEDLEKWLDPQQVLLVAEHGAWFRRKTGVPWERVISQDDAWKERVRPILAGFVDRIPGSRIEEKEYGLVWHYRRADQATAHEAAKELVDALTNLTANQDLHVLLGGRSVEVKSTRAGKGTFYGQRLAGAPWNFTFAAGDDATDEGLFAALPPDGVSVRVGLAASAARFNVESVDGLLVLLEEFARKDEPAPA